MIGLISEEKKSVFKMEKDMQTVGHASLLLLDLVIGYVHSRVCCIVVQFHLGFISC